MFFRNTRLLGYLLFFQNTRLSANQFEVTIKTMQQLGVLVAGAPNAAYDVELVVPSLKNMSVYKRYFLPLQGMLPVIPQVTFLFNKYTLFYKQPFFSNQAQCCLTSSLIEDKILFQCCLLHIDFILF